MSAFNEKGRANRLSGLAEMRQRWRDRQAHRRGGAKTSNLPPCPTVAEQEEMMLWVASCPAEELVARLHDEELRHTFNSVFNYWVIRTQIRALRLHRGWTQAELARRAGLDQELISRYENVFLPTDMRVGTLLKIAHAFDVTFACRFCDWQSLLDDVASMTRFGENIPSFDEDPAMRPND